MTEGTKWIVRLLVAVGAGVACSALIGVLVFRLSLRGVSLHLEPFDAYVLVNGLPTALVGLCAYQLAGRLFLRRSGRPAANDR